MSPNSQLLGILSPISAISFRKKNRRNWCGSSINSFRRLPRFLHRLDCLHVPHLQARVCLFP